MIGEFETVENGPVAFSPVEPGHAPQAPRPVKVKECGAVSAGTNRLERVSTPSNAASAFNCRLDYSQKIVVKKTIEFPVYPLCGLPKVEFLPALRFSLY